MRYGLLGRLEIVGDDGQLITLAANKERVVLAALLLGANRLVPTSRLFDALWGDRPPDTANNALQVQVSRLRKRLSSASIDGEMLRTEPYGYSLTVAPGALDVERFEALIGVEKESPEEESSRLAEALRLWRGPALADVESDALAAEATRLNDLRWLARERRIEADLTLGRHLDVVPELEALVAEEPLREGVRRQLMTALYRSGRQADALAVYRQTRDVLAEQLGIDPGPALQELELAILNQAPELDLPAQARPHLVGTTLPAGTVTLVFTDIEGSTRLLSEIGAERYAEVLTGHRALVRGVVSEHRGVEIRAEGDALFMAFGRASDALACAESIQEALASGLVRVRIGVHTGEPLIVDGDYVGLDMHKAARICSAAHGGQTLVSQTTSKLVVSGLHDLGVYRLKDLDAPERLFQLGDGNFAPPRTLRQANLPVQPTPLIGRQRELDDLVMLVQRHRLVTLTGPGGTGKTRLGLQVAAELADLYDDGVWWVPLAAVSDPRLVLPSIAQTVGAREDLTGALAAKQMLILLDNLEQLLDAAPSLGELLAAVPGLTVLATSRERLAIAGEHEYAVDPLDEATATELFVTRARQVKPDFQPDDAVWEICRRLDRLPLALELASTRVKVLSTGQILDRLERRLDLLNTGGRDSPARQTTMRAALDWSYELLSDNERQLFRGLGVFPGGFHVDAAEAVCGGGLDDLQSLVDKSLIKAAEGRFSLLEVTREYALERLDEAGERDDNRRRHAEWFFRLGQASPEAIGAHTGLISARHLPWLERLRADTDNFRVAFAWALEHDVAAGIDLASKLLPVWQMRGQLAELARWLERALAVPGLDKNDRALGLRLYSNALNMTGQYARAREAIAESLEFARREGDLSGEANALRDMGNVEWAAGDLDTAIQLHQQALSIWRQIDYQPGTALALHSLGDDLRDAGEFASAEIYYRESVAMSLARDNSFGAVYSLHSLGDLGLDQGDAQAARQSYRESLSRAFELGDLRSQAYCLAGLACAAALDGDDGGAGWLWAVVESAERQIEACFEPKERRRYEAIVDPLVLSPGFRTGLADGQTMLLEQAVQKILAD
jgi:predicted ATPase/class 3 adenylate cyclase/DNA-binding winged helix-turn-helix (wHTH) protein